jgi:hypothetical protein
LLRYAAGLAFGRGAYLLTLLPLLRLS